MISFGELLDFAGGGALRRPFEYGLPHGQALGEGHPLLNLGLEDRHADIGGHVADVPPDNRIPYFAGNH